jgi:hypothetical protein
MRRKDHMYFAYFDESGDPGRINSPTLGFSLSAVLVHDKDWLNLLDNMKKYRGFLRDTFGLKLHDEIKANYMIHGKHAFEKLSDDVRRRIYRGLMRFQLKCEKIRTFAVVVKKQAGADYDVRLKAWTLAIERLERFGKSKNENLHVLPDSGSGDFVRGLIRKMRRHNIVPSAFGGKPLERNADNIIEDSSERLSHESYFIQLADLNAYAAYRCVFPIAPFDGSMWNELGCARIHEVNSISGGPCGIKVWT